MSRTSGAQFARFTGVGVLGLAVDLGAAWVLTTQGGVPLLLAAGLGFVLGATVNYVAHELWTFAEAGRTLSLARWASYLLGMGAILVVRLVALAGLGAMVGSRAGSDLALLLGATALSFVANYLLSRFVVFRRAPSARPAAPRTSGSGPDAA